MIVAAARGVATVAHLGLCVVIMTADLVPARAQPLDDLYAGAKSEGALAFYAGGPTAPWEARAKAFGRFIPE